MTVGAHSSEQELALAGTRPSEFRLQPDPVDNPPTGLAG